MDHVIGLKCVLCGAEYGPDEVLYVCPKHGDEGILDVVYDYDLVSRHLTRESLAANGDLSIWRLPEEGHAVDRVDWDAVRDDVPAPVVEPGDGPAHLPLLIEQE